MTEITNLCFIGGHGTGKRTALMNFLRNYAQKEHIPFHVKTKYLMGKLLNTVSSSGGGVGNNSDSDDDDDEPAPTRFSSTNKANNGDEDGPSPDGKSFPFEVSAIHQGYDIARMSLQDKNYIYTIFKNFHGSSYVLSRSNYHFFVFYHAHLLSEESIIFLQEKLEQYSNSLRIFFTSDYPLPHRLADHFMEVYMDTDTNHLYNNLKTTYTLSSNTSGWKQWFEKTLNAWNTKSWNTADVPAIRNWIYFCLQRNLRWCEMIEYWTVAIQECPLEKLSLRKKIDLFRILSFAEGGGGWQIIPSYRIPLLWEHVLLALIKVLRS